MKIEIRVDQQIAGVNDLRFCNTDTFGLMDTACDSQKYQKKCEKNTQLHLNISKGTILIQFYFVIIYVN